MIFLPDTNVFSAYLRNRREDASICAKLEMHLQACRLSTIALMELNYGAAKRPDVPVFAERVRRLRAIFGAVESFDAEDAYQAAAIRGYLANLKPNAQPIRPYDLLLAGQAVARGATFVTSNIKEFRRVPGLSVEDWRE